ncbi:hypothetical protein T12_10906 [Trichinella patagoniensis]|uniref:Uncharacterized protein n=1 Tax=Trichinella patagoniensis TaxID=990121 RepID=A0A0V0Z1H4_9BILA|nr:hypothetical protein T12_10906 [Trichinella patagoniensis]
MKEIRLAQNNEILHNALQFQRIPHYNVKKLSYTKIQPSSIRFNGVSDGPLPCNLAIYNKKSQICDKSLLSKIAKTAKAIA